MHVLFTPEFKVHSVHSSVEGGITVQEYIPIPATERGRLEEDWYLYHRSDNTAGTGLESCIYK